MSHPEPDPEPRLLLEDYGSQARQWLARFASQPRPRPAGSAADSNGRPAPPIHLLLEDFTRRRDEWWTRYQQSPPKSKPAPQSADQADLSLLVEDYYDARRRASKAARARERAAHAPPPPASLDPVPADEIPVDLLVHWDTNLTLSGNQRPMVLSLLAHVILVGILILQPNILPFRQRPLDLETPNFTMLTPPEDFLKELTQPEPNEGPVSIEFEGKDELPVPVMKPPEQPAPAPPALHAEPEPEPVPEPPPTVEVTPEEPTPEPPPERRDPEPNPEAPPPAIAARSPNPGEFNPDRRLGRPAELPMPKPPSRPAKRPRLQLEDPRTGSPGRVGPAQLGSLALNARPGQLVEGAIRNLSASGGRGGRQAVGDGSGTGGLSGYLPPSPGNAGSNLELLSDPMGVDFRPYLLQVLASVRRNWYAVIPESARLGMNRGSVAIQLRVVRSGSVAKLVIANSSGTNSLDRAAVAGISASNPLPPLPSDYKGSDVSFQFVFRYNLKR